MSIAFDSDGITYAGSGDGFIFRFAEQAQDFMVKAHPLPDGSTNWPPKGADHSLCRVTAMWFDKNKGLLYSSGDDGWLHAWKPQQWDPRASDHTPNPKPVKSFDLNQWVSPSSTAPSSRWTIRSSTRPTRCAAGRRRRTRYTATRMATFWSAPCATRSTSSTSTIRKTAPMCYVQGHYDELWGWRCTPRSRSSARARRTRRCACGTSSRARSPRWPSSTAPCAAPPTRPRPSGLPSAWAASRRSTS